MHADYLADAARLQHGGDVGLGVGQGHPAAEIGQGPRRHHQGPKTHGGHEGHLGQIDHQAAAQAGEQLERFVHGQRPLDIHPPGERRQGDPVRQFLDLEIHDSSDPDPP